MSHPAPPSHAARPAPIAEAYLLVRQDLRDRIAAHPNDPQLLVIRGLAGSAALA